MRCGESLYIYLFVASSFACSCPNISPNVLFKKVFLVLIFQSTCFIYITWKHNKQIMGQQPHRPCQWTTANKNNNKIMPTSYSNWPRVLLFNLAHEQCNGIIKRWLHCLATESKLKFLAINILLAWCLVIGANTIFFNKKLWLDVQNTR